MSIAILGWGSLLWEQHPEFDRWHDEWRPDGPTLKLEFSRISETRLGALTLVIDEEHGALATVNWCLSKRMAIEDAVCDLRCREGTSLKYISSVVVPKDDQAPTGATVEEIVIAWAREQKPALDFVAWTALKSNFSKKKGKSFSVDAAVEHMLSLGPQAKAKAAEYVWRAPEFVQTPLRSKLECEPWFKADG